MKGQIKARVVKSIRSREKKKRTESVIRKRRICRQGTMRRNEMKGEGGEGIRRGEKGRRKEGKSQRQNIGGKVGKDRGKKESREAGSD